VIEFLSVLVFYLIAVVVFLHVKTRIDRRIGARSDKMGKTLTRIALGKIMRDRLAMGCLYIIFFYLLLGLLTKFSVIYPAYYTRVDRERPYSEPMLYIQHEDETEDPDLDTVEKRIADSRERIDQIKSNLEAQIAAWESEREEGVQEPRPRLSFGLRSEIFWEQVKQRLPTIGFADPLGRDIQGRSVVSGCTHAIRTAINVGLVTSLIAIPIGLVLGALAGFYGGKVDDFIVWLYSTVASIPSLLLILSISYVILHINLESLKGTVFEGIKNFKGLFAVYIAIGMTTWVGLCRLIRAEFLKHKERDYVASAQAVGAGDSRVIFRHILPNVFHLVIINFSIRFVFAVQTEVIVSYLGLGVQGMASWGRMINDAKQALGQGVWWELAGATGFMFFLVLAFNIFGDILRDALDPKLRDA
jgi:peptide/nickel transport system permease protein